MRSEQPKPETRPAPAPAVVDLDKESTDETDAGVGIPIEDIERWVESWDTDTELPMPKARKVR